MQVILATDGSIEADIATAVCKRLPLGNGTQITVASVMQIPVTAPVEVVAGIHDDSEDRAAETWRLERKISRQMVERIAEDFRHRGYVAEALLLEGETADELLRLIRDQSSDLVLTGCGVSNTVAAFFMGSIARKLVLYSDTSVLLGRPFGEAQAMDSCKRIQQKEKLDLLVAFDASKGSEMALDSLAKLKTPLFNNVYVLTVEPYLYMAATDLSLYMPISETDRSRVQAIADQAAERISGCADHVHALTSFGRPAAEISRAAKEKDVDLVVIGANRHGALERMVLGSCAYETAMGAPCSVLILRDQLEFEA